MPHNLLVTDEGMTVYVIPRKFDMLLESSFFTSFESLCGYVKFKNKAAYESSSEESVTKALTDQVSLSEAEFNELKSGLVSKFTKEYECEGDGVAEALAKLKI
jgi:hypothetical protein